jgi:hypothetical protein
LTPTTRQQRLQRHDIGMHLAGGLVGTIGKHAVQVRAQGMDQQQVHFLDARGAGGGHAQLDVPAAQQRRQRAAILAGQRQHPQAACLRRAHGFEHVARIARGGECHQHVAGPTQRFDLAREHALVGVIVGDRGQHTAVRREGNPGQPDALALEAVDQFRGQMLGVAR